MLKGLSIIRWTPNWGVILLFPMVVAPSLAGETESHANPEPALSAVDRRPIDATVEPDLIIAPEKEHATGAASEMIIQDVVVEAQRPKWREYSSCAMVNALLCDLLVDTPALSACKFERVTFRFSSLLPVKIIDNCQFHECTVEELSLTGGRIQGTELDNCVIDELDLNNVTLTDVAFRNCKIERLRMSRCRVENALFLGCRIGAMVLNDCDVDGIDLHACIHDPGLGRLHHVSKQRGVQHDFSGLRAHRGVLRNLDMKAFRIDPANVSLYEVQLSAPVFSAQLVKDLDIRRLLWTSRGLVIGQEIEAQDDELSHARAVELLREARSIYALLQRRYAEAGFGREERFMTYRLGVVNRGLLESRIRARLDYLWNELCRGRYGTDPMVVVGTAIGVCVFFAMLYFVLGWMHVAWGLIIPESMTGQVGDGGVAHFICGAGAGHVVRYSSTCFAFSMNRLLFGGTRAFDLINPSDLFTLAPSRYKSIGIGRLISGLEGLAGLILLTNFIRAFVRTL